MALAVALALAVGACATPVERDTPLGFAIEWTAYGEVGPGHHTVRALDALVPAAARFAVETSRAERPSVPRGHEWPAGGSWTRVRYTADAPRRAQADAWADSMRALVGAYNVRVAPVVERGRVSLAAATLKRLGRAISPSDPAVSDEALQAVLDREVDRLGSGPGSPYHRLRPRVGRLPDGRRIVAQGEASAVLLEDGVRIWVRPDAVPSQQITFDGVTSERLLFRTENGWRSVPDTVRGARPRR